MISENTDNRIPIILTNSKVKLSLDEFNHTALTNQGRLLITSHEGCIRDYKDSGSRRATKKYHHTHEKVNSIILSKNGNWLATVIPNKILLTRQGGYNPFNNRQQGKSSYKLEIRESHFFKTGNFTKVVFNHSKENEDLLISTYIENKVFTWKFSDLFQDRLDSYEIYECTETIIDILYDVNHKGLLIIAFEKSLISHEIIQ